MFTGEEEHRISLAKARAMLAEHRKSAGPAADGPWCEFFGRKAIEALLGQPGCVGIRIYHGRNDAGRHALVLVGADKDGKDMLSTETILEEGVPCPPWCDTGSALST